MKERYGKMLLYFILYLIILLDGVDVYVINVNEEENFYVF